MPAPLVATLQSETAKALQQADVRDHILAGAGRDIVASKPEEFEALFRADLAKFARIGREAKIPFQD